MLNMTFEAGGLRYQPRGAVTLNGARGLEVAVYADDNGRGWVQEAIIFVAGEPTRAQVADAYSDFVLLRMADDFCGED